MTPLRGQPSPPATAQAETSPPSRPEAAPPADPEHPAPPVDAEHPAPPVDAEHPAPPVDAGRPAPPAAKERPAPSAHSTTRACPNCAFEPARALGWAPPAERPQVACPEDAAALVVDVLRGLDRERCLLVTLDTKHRLLATATVSVGTADHTFMAPREIYRDALLAGASAIFLAHNHPSGDPTPSADDRQVTRRLAQAGATLGVDLLDHLVVGEAEWVSLARSGVL